MVGPVHETIPKDFKDLEPSRVMFSDHISFKEEINRNTAEGVFPGFAVLEKGKLNKLYTVEWK